MNEQGADDERSAVLPCPHLPVEPTASDGLAGHHRFTAASLLDHSMLIIAISSERGRFAQLVLPPNLDGRGLLNLSENVLNSLISQQLSRAARREVRAIVSSKPFKHINFQTSHRLSPSTIPGGRQLVGVCR